MSEFDNSIQKLAANIANKAIEDATPFAEKLDALGKLTAYYSLLLKKRLPADNEDDEPSMGEFQERLRAAQEDGDDGQRPAAPVRTRARRINSN